MIHFVIYLTVLHNKNVYDVITYILVLRKKCIKLLDQLTLTISEFNYIIEGVI